MSKVWRFRGHGYTYIMDMCFLFVPRSFKKFTDFLFLVQSIVHDLSLFVMSLLLSPEIIRINGASSIVIQPREERTRAIRSLTAQIVMFHCVIPTLSKNVTLRKLCGRVLQPDPTRPYPTGRVPARVGSGGFEIFAGMIRVPEVVLMQDSTLQSCSFFDISHLSL